VLDEAPGTRKATQALGDLYAGWISRSGRRSITECFLICWVDPKDETKALAIYNRFLKKLHRTTSPETDCALRVSAAKAESPGTSDRAVQQSGELFHSRGANGRCAVLLGRVAQLDPDNLNAADEAGRSRGASWKKLIAARAYLRAGQLATAGGSYDNALKLASKSACACSAGTKCGDALCGVEIAAQEMRELRRCLEPFAATESDARFLETFSDPR